MPRKLTGYVYTHSYQLGELSPGTFGRFASRMDAAVSAGRKYQLSQGEVASLEADGYVYLTQDNSSKLSTECVSIERYDAKKHGFSR